MAGLAARELAPLPVLARHAFAPRVRTELAALPPTCAGCASWIERVQSNRITELQSDGCTQASDVQSSSCTPIHMEGTS
jgi:hypothetical protein